MSFNGSGTFQINSTGQPVVTGTVISSTAFNALTADLATGLSTCITKDGQTTPSANIPLGGYKITNLAAGTNATDAVNYSQLQSSAAKYLSVSGTDTITASLTPALTVYTAGDTFSFTVANTNTTSVTINIDSLGAKAITRDGSTALAAGDLVAGEIVMIVYDGTRFQVINPNAFTNLNVSGTATVATLSVTGTVGALTSTSTFTDTYGKVRAIPKSGSDKTTTYTLATTDVGQFISIGTSGSISVPNATFSTGDVVSIYNSTASDATLSFVITNAYIAGSSTNKSTMTLAQKGVATVLFISGTTCVVTGSVT